MVFDGSRLHIVKLDVLAKVETVPLQPSWLPRADVTFTEINIIIKKFLIKLPNIAKNCSKHARQHGCGARWQRVDSMGRPAVQGGSGLTARVGLRCKMAEG